MSGRIRKRSRKRVENNPFNITDIISETLPNEGNPSTQNLEADDEDVENSEDGMAVVETYAEYWPAKLNIGKKHPDPVVETASLSSVESADIDYKLKIPHNVISKGLLSALQLESIAYASQAHERLLLDADNSRAGFLIGKF